MEKRVWIAKSSYDQYEPVMVSHSPIDGLFRVEQQGKEIIICSNLCLKECFLNHCSGVITGYIATIKELSDLHNSKKHNENECFPYRAVRFTMRGFQNDSGELIEWAEYLDMVADDNPSMIALYPSGKTCPEIPF